MLGRVRLILYPLLCVLFVGSSALAGEPSGKESDMANLEALLNIIANGMEIWGLSSGIPMFALGITLLFLRDRRMLSVVFLVLGPILTMGGLAIPGIINWLVASARDARLFD